MVRGFSRDKRRHKKLGFSPSPPSKSRGFAVYEIAPSQIPNLKSQISNLKFPSPAAHSLVSNLKSPPSNFRPQISNLQPPISNFRPPAALSRARQRFFRACRLAGHALWRKPQRARENTAFFNDRPIRRRCPITSYFSSALHRAHPAKHPNPVYVYLTPHTAPFSRSGSGFPRSWPGFLLPNHPQGPINLVP